MQKQMWCIVGKLFQQIYWIVQYQFFVMVDATAKKAMEETDV